MNIIRIKVENMTCHHCVKTVENAIMALDGVVGVGVELQTGDVTIEGPVSYAAVKESIEDAGFDIA